MTNLKSNAITVKVLDTLPESVRGLDVTTILLRFVRTIIREVILQ